MISFEYVTLETEQLQFEQKESQIVQGELQTILRPSVAASVSEINLEEQNLSTDRGESEIVELDSARQISYELSYSCLLIPRFPDHYLAGDLTEELPNLVGVEHRMLWGNVEEYRSRLKANGLSGNINTSFVERANLTIRQGVSKLTRRTWGPAKLKSELEDHLYWRLAYYHFARPHESLRITLPEPFLRKRKQRPRQYQKVTPAMAAGLVTRRWSVMVPVSARERADQLPAAIKIGGGKDQWGGQAFLYGSLHGLYPDLPRTTHFKQKRAQKSTF